MIHLLRLTLIAAALIVPNAVQAQHTITFEGTGCNQTGPGYFASVRNGYESFDWNNFYAFDMHDPACAGNRNFFLGAPPSGLYNGVHSGDWDAYDPGCCIALTMSRPGDPFNVLGLWATSELLTGMKLTVLGFGAGGGLLYNNVFTIDSNAPSYLDLEYMGIESLSMSWVVGTGVDAQGNSATSRFAVDDIVVSGSDIVNDPTTAPEPASIVLMLTGLSVISGIAAGRRTKR
jgi:hypothetical protein